MDFVAKGFPRPLLLLCPYELGFQSLAPCDLVQRGSIMCVSLLFERCKVFRTVLLAQALKPETLAPHLFHILFNQFLSGSSVRQMRYQILPESHRLPYHTQLSTPDSC